MSVIQNFLTKILEARYGEEVRGSIHDAIDQCYKDATGHPDSVAAVVEQNDQMAELLENTPYTTAIEDTEIFELPVHTIRDNVTTEVSTWSSKKIQDKLDDMQDEIDSVQNELTVKIENKFIVINGSHNGIKYDSSAQKTVTIGTVAKFGSAANLQVIFAGQDQRSRYESASGSIETDYANVYRPMVNASLAGMDNDQVFAEVTPVVNSITESQGNLSIKFTLKPVGILYDQDMYYDIKYRIILMKLS